MAPKIVKKQAGFSKRMTSKDLEYSRQYVSESKQRNNSPLPLILSALALIIAIIALIISFTSFSDLANEQKMQIAGIAKDLRTIQTKNIALKSPLKATVIIDKTFLLSDLISDNISLNANAMIPIKGELIARNPDGSISNFDVDDKIHVNASIPISAKDSLEGATLNIQDEIPIETEFTVNLNVKAVYGKEFNDLIERLEAMSEIKQ